MANKLEDDEQGGMVSKRMLERYIEPCSMLGFYFALLLLRGWGEVRSVFGLEVLNRGVTNFH